MRGNAGKHKEFRPCGGQFPKVSLSVTVVFTTVTGTLDALREAAGLAHELGAEIRILVAHVVPYPLPLDHPRLNAAIRLRRVRTVIEDYRVETRVEIRLCRDVRQCIHDSLEPHSLVLIGGGDTRWPLTREKRLARSLTRAGHQVISIGHRKQSTSKDVC